MSRVQISSGYPFESIYGYSRAIRAGNLVFVSGTTARPPDLDGDAYIQARGALRIVAAALDEAGAQLSDVVRTVAYVIDAADVERVARAHSEAFGDIRPASTLVRIAGLTPAAARVEIEVTAVISE
jgi:enamine deaminase RidA (YjgF/YER057c/UK114 family)